MRIYVTSPSWKSKKLMNLLKEKAEVVIPDKRPTQSEFQQIIKDYDGTIIGRLHDINKEVLDNSNLKFVGLVAKGTNNIDVGECKKHNVSVFYTPEANLTSVAEHVFALILSVEVIISITTPSGTSPPFLSFMPCTKVSAAFALTCSMSASRPSPRRRSSSSDRAGLRPRPFTPTPV